MYMATHRDDVWVPKIITPRNTRHTEFSTFYLFLKIGQTPNT